MESKIAHSSRGDTHMHRNNFIAYFLSLACLIILIPDLAAAQSGKVKSALADLTAMAGTLGAPKLQGSALGCFRALDILTGSWH